MIDNKLPEIMRTAIYNELKMLCDESTEIHITKYELFTAARKKTDSWIGYKEHKAEINNIINDFCETYGYTFTIRQNYHECGHMVNEYFIITEPIEACVSKSTRNRIYIPAHIVKSAGFIPGQKCAYIKTSDQWGNTYFDVVSADVSYKYIHWETMKVMTVEKDGGIRFSVDQFDYITTVTATAGLIRLK